MSRWYTDGPMTPPEYKEEDYCAECDEYKCEHMFELSGYDTLKEWRDEA